MKPELESGLRKMGISSFNEMQISAHAAFREHAAVLLLAPTGSGKTIAYLIPLLEFLLENKDAKALIIVPARELALQIESVASKLNTGIKVTACYGGRRIETEENNLKAGPRLIIGTPGRLTDHIRNGNLPVKDFRFLVIDEYDKALEMGFMKEMNNILGQLEDIRKTCLVSATEVNTIPESLLFENLQKLDFLFLLNPVLKYYRYDSPVKDKLASLLELLHKTGGMKTIVFSNHRESAERIQEYLQKNKVKAALYHGALDQSQREHALFLFKSGCRYILNTTDLASRGLDISEVKYIIHYHLPTGKEEFIHRNGRTARMHADGSVILLMGPEEEIPEYVEEEIQYFKSKTLLRFPESPWISIFIGAGKKEKLNRVDIVGFFIKEGKLQKDAIGLIEVKDHHSFVAVKSGVADTLLKNIKGKKIKKLHPKIAIAR
jgi:superfamily II DNA/RNA helicase